MAMVPDPEDVPELLELYREAVRGDFSDQANFYYDILFLGTLNLTKLFQAHPPITHPKLWEAVYVTQNDSWRVDVADGALVYVMQEYEDLARGTYPPLGLLKHWVGHGYGYQGVRQTPGQPMAGPGKRKRALVPGYGRGADALFLAKYCGYDVVALDTSGTALTSAWDLELSVNNVLLQYLHKEPIDNVHMRPWAKLAKLAEKRGQELGSGTIEWRLGNFLHKNCFSEDEKFDFIFDNYFFSALHPSLRSQWAQRMVDLLARPHGRLMCREFPSDKDVVCGGPPYSAALLFYQLHLTYPGSDKVVDYVKGVIDLSAETTSTSGTGLKQVARFLSENMDHKIMRTCKTWVSFWCPSLGGARLGETSQSSKADESTGTSIEVKIVDNKKITLKRRKAHEDLRDLAVDGAASSKSSISSEEDDIYGAEPERKLVKRVKFSMPSICSMGI